MSGIRKTPVRRSCKRGSTVPKYGDIPKHKKLTRGRKKSNDDKFLERLNDQLAGGKKADKLMDYLSDPNSKLRKRLTKINDAHYKKENDKRKKSLMKAVPLLKDVKEKLSVDLFDDLLMSLLDELDNAIQKGYNSAPPSSSSGYSMRADMGSVPSGSFILSPYTNYNY